MTKPRVTSTDRLADIIEVVELGRRSGLLTVERGSGPALEQGEIYFMQGRATHAKIEGLRGRDALSQMAGWGQCRFAFEANTPSPAPNIAAPQPLAEPAAQRQTGMTGVSPMDGGGATGFFPAPQRAQPTPQRGAPTGFNWNIAPAPPSQPMPDPFIPPSAPFSSQPGAQPGWGQNAQPGWQGAPYSQPPSSPPSTPSSTGEASWPGNWPTGGQGWSQPGMPPTSPSGAPPAYGSPFSPLPPQTGPFNAPAQPVTQRDMMRMPRRAPDVRDLINVVNTYRLSRSHRTLLLLADGEHTVLDLARLASKPVDEIIALLADLERHGLVYYY